MDQLALFDAPSFCSVDGCELLAKRKALRLCTPHYKRHWRYGDPTAGGPRRLNSKPGVPVVDLDDDRRQCRTCGEAKALDQFPVDKGGTKGRRAECKPCHTARAKAWYAENKGEHLPRARARYQRDIEKIRERDMQRYQRDKPKRLELVVEAGHRRRALLRSVPSERGITVTALRKRDGDACCYCNETMSFAPATGHTFVPLRATIEHVVPLSLNGHHTWDNVALACWQCNVRKNATPLDEWLTNVQVSGSEHGGRGGQDL